MGIELATAYVSLTASAKGISKSITNELGGPLDSASKDAGKRAGGIFSGSMGSVIKAAGGLFIARELFSFAKSSVAAARESNRVGAQTTAVIKSTGGAARVTAGEVGRLASAIARKTGVDDEAIQSGQNLLLTFTNIRNEAGKGNDIFNQSTQVITDMSVALGQDMKSSAIQLGKALNDPIKGVTALSRVGVSFTEQQKEQIRTLTESGRSLDAQKIILAELNKEFGGSALAQSTAADRLKVSMGDIQESVGGLLIPAIDAAALWLSDKLPRAIDVGKAAAAEFLAGFRGDKTDSTIGYFGQQLGVIVEKVRADILPALGDFKDFLKDDVLPVVKEVGGFLAEHFTEIAAGYLTYKTLSLGINAATTSMNALKLAMASSGGGWAVAIGGGVALGIGLNKLIEQHFPGVNRALESAGGKMYDFGARSSKSLGDAGAAAYDFYANTRDALGKVVSFIADLPAKIGRAASGMFDGIKNAFRSAVNFIISKWNNLELKIGGQTLSLGPLGKVNIPEASLKTFNIPLLADGGVVAKPTLAILGETGPEAVVPLRQYKAGMPQDSGVTVTTHLHVAGDVFEINGVRKLLEEHDRELSRRLRAGSALYA